ncbi:SPOR domain-containing protein [Polaribacter sp. ALD11]|uniref:SPOR domain-containing protein n=1 Tax=Polaribacter sp. ALD11 TaxID=2058137 RepID=UPI000C317E7F|nr:SPOR domain-containing protein [Polaribacter sp. ALD11]AUC86528.1 SPOR domain-containing protein [Polaribacter sp. ALD11]
MKNIFLALFCIVLFSCTKNEKKEVVPVENTEVNEVVTPVEAEVIIEDRLVFTVQIAALQNKNKVLANLENINVFLENGLTKYRLGSFETYKEARSFRNQLITNYKGAFVQALLNDAPIVISEALQY